MANSLKQDFLWASAGTSSASLMSSTTGITSEHTSSPGDSQVYSLIPEPGRQVEIMVNGLQFLSVQACGASFATISCSDRTPQLKVVMRRWEHLPIFSSVFSTWCTPNRQADYRAVTHSTPLVAGIPSSIVVKGSPVRASLSLVSPISQFSEHTMAHGKTTCITSLALRSIASCFNFSSEQWSAGMDSGLPL